MQGYFPLGPDTADERRKVSGGVGRFIFWTPHFVVDIPKRLGNTLCMVKTVSAAARRRAMLAAGRRMRLAMGGHVEAKQRAKDFQMARNRQTARIIKAIRERED